MIFTYMVNLGKTKVLTNADQPLSMNVWFVYVRAKRLQHKWVQYFENNVFFKYNIKLLKCAKNIERLGIIIFFKMQKLFFAKLLFSNFLFICKI